MRLLAKVYFALMEIPLLILRLTFVRTYLFIVSILEALYSRIEEVNKKIAEEIGKRVGRDRTGAQDVVPYSPAAVVFGLLLLLIICSWCGWVIAARVR